MDNNLQYIVEVVNNFTNLNLPQPKKSGVINFIIFSLIIVSIVFLSIKNSEKSKEEASTQNINMPDNNGTVHIEQHIYKSEIAQEDEYYEDEKEAKRNIENRKHLVFIQNLPNEKRIALENAHKKWDTGVTYDMKEGNSEYINFLEEMWLTLSEFYTSRNFSGKTSKQYINDYIKERFDYHSSKHIINGEFLGGSMHKML